MIPTLSLSIIIPAYNEERRLAPTLATVCAYLNASPYRNAEIVVVDDGSSDRTAALVEAAATQDSRVRLLRNPGNRGKGYSVRHGMLEARGDWLLFTDADLSAPIETKKQPASWQSILTSLEQLRQVTPPPVLASSPTAN